MAAERGALLPRIEEVMEFLSRNHPPLRFPAATDREEEEAAVQWQRGGTSPSGRDLGDVTTATWFVGETYLAASYGAPQRIIWLPPEPGQERFGPPDRAGYMQRREQPGGEGPDLGDRTFRRIMTRIMPVTADLWCNDYDDLDILVHWLASAVFCTNAGAPENVGEASVQSGGLIPVQHGQRGIRYQMVVNFVFPISAPFSELHAAQRLTVTTRLEGEGHAAQRRELREDVRREEERVGIRQPHDLTVTPWRRRSISDPSAEPVAEPDPDEEGTVT